MSCFDLGTLCGCRAKCLTLLLYWAGNIFPHQTSPGTVWFWMKDIVRLGTSYQLECQHSLINASSRDGRWVVCERTDVNLVKQRTYHSLKCLSSLLKQLNPSLYYYSTSIKWLPTVSEGWISWEGRGRNRAGFLWRHFSFVHETHWANLFAVESSLWISCVGYMCWQQCYVILRLCLNLVLARVNISFPLSKHLLFIF